MKVFGRYIVSLMTDFAGAFFRAAKVEYARGPHCARPGYLGGEKNGEASKKII